MKNLKAKQGALGALIEEACWEARNPQPKWVHVDPPFDIREMPRTHMIEMLTSRLENTDALFVLETIYKEWVELTEKDITSA